MAIFLAGKAVCYRILAFFCYGKLHFKCESADLFAVLQTVQFNKVIKRYTAVCISATIGRMIFASSPVNINIRTIHIP